MSQPSLAQTGSSKLIPLTPRNRLTNFRPPAPSTSANLASDLKPPGEAAAAVKVQVPSYLRPTNSLFLFFFFFSTLHRLIQSPIALLRMQRRKSSSGRMHALLQ